MRKQVWAVHSPVEMYKALVVYRRGENYSLGRTNDICCETLITMEAIPQVSRCSTRQWRERSNRQHVPLLREQKGARAAAEPCWRHTAGQCPYSWLLSTTPASYDSIWGTLKGQPWEVCLVGQLLPLPAAEGFWNQCFASLTLQDSPADSDSAGLSEAPDSARLTSSQEMLLQLVQRPHFEERVPGEYACHFPVALRTLKWESTRNYRG